MPPFSLPYSRTVLECMHSGNNSGIVPKIFYFQSESDMSDKGSRKRGPTAQRQWINHWWTVGEEGSLVVYDDGPKNAQREIIKNYHVIGVVSDKYTGSNDLPGHKLIFTLASGGKKRMYLDKFIKTKNTVEAVSDLVSSVRKDSNKMGKFEK